MLVEIAAHVVECSNKINIFIGKIRYTVHMFRHGCMCLSCCHKPVGMCSVMREHGMGNIISFPSYVPDPILYLFL